MFFDVGVVLLFMIMLSRAEKFDRLTWIHIYFQNHLPKTINTIIPQQDTNIYTFQGRREPK